MPFFPLSFHCESPDTIEISKKKEGMNMKAVMKREVKNYLKNPLFWVGIVVEIGKAGEHCGCRYHERICQIHEGRAVGTCQEKDDQYGCKGER